MNKINGIDVSECVFFKERYTRIGDDVDNDISFENHCMLSECTFSIGDCEKINCHYKQLKHLQDKYNTVVNKFFNSETDKTRLQEENKELKEQLCETKQFLKDVSEENSKFCQQIEALRQNWRLDCLKCEYKNTKADVDKYKQALEEIRDYCDEQNLKADYTACEVLSIIDKVLDEN